MPCSRWSRRSWHRMRLCSGRGFGCGLRNRLLRGLAGGTHVPALALICPIRVVVPVGSLRRGRFRCCKTIIGACRIGHTDVYARNEKVTINAINPTSLGICCDMIPSTTPDPRKSSLENSTVMRCNCGAWCRFQIDPRVVPVRDRVRLPWRWPLGATALPSKTNPAPARPPLRRCTSEILLLGGRPLFRIARNTGVANPGHASSTAAMSMSPLTPPTGSRCNLVGLTDMITHDDLRSTIARHIEEARRMVTEQKGRIARLKATGVDTAFAELTLRALEANLKRFQNHADWSERKEQNSAEPSRVTGEGQSEANCALLRRRPAMTWRVARSA